MKKLQDIFDKIAYWFTDGISKGTKIGRAHV